MKILLDENIDKNLKKILAEYDVYTVKDMKWLGKKNGELLKLAVENEFKIFISNDTKIKSQQNIKNFKLNFIIIKNKGNDINLLLPLIPQIYELIMRIKDTTEENYFEIS